jgi:N-acetylmuramoyl-L-alanine amidase
MPAAGTDLVNLASKHFGEKYHLGIMVPKDHANWSGPWDCAEFASWVIFQTAGVLYGCFNDFSNPSSADAYTGYWDRDAGILGHIITLEEAARTPGAAVLRRPAPGANGHIVFSDGTGGTVEAHSTADGVIKSTLAGRRWDMGILVPEIGYTVQDPVTVVPPATPIYRLTTPPMSGPAILDIQNKLKAKGFNPGTIDGVFGPHTQAAVVAFQVSLGLTADGEVGPLTAKALE